MTKKKTKVNAHQLDLKGRKIGGIICDDYVVVGDAVLIMDQDGQKGLFTSASLTKEPKKYAIEKLKVEKIECTKDRSLFIFKTKNKTYFRDHKNMKFEGSHDWSDYYLDADTGDFFRKDQRGKWYDIQGYLLKTTFLIKDQVLFSLDGKTSRRSLFYRNQVIFTTPKNTMIQVGKVVYDVHLNVLNYFGEKITGLGPVNVSFDDNSSIQEVYLGLTKKGFIDEESYAPFLINGEEIVKHLATQKIGDYKFELFKSDQSQFVICNAVENILIYKGKILNVDFDTYLHIGDHHLIKTKNQQPQFYFDLKSGSPFTPINDKVLIIDIKPESIQLSGRQLYNMTGLEGNFVFDSTRNSTFKIKDNSIIPESIHLIPDFDQLFFTAKIDGTLKLCNAKTNEVIQIGDQSIEISEIVGDSNQKLLNITTPKGQRFALDARFGFDQLKLATVGDFKIVEALDQPFRLGNEIVQNVLLETLGGSKKRVVNLNHEELSIVGLPKDLTAYAEQTELSVFANNELVEINFTKPISIEDELFFEAKFIDYINEEKSVILQEKNGRPLQLDGVGHRNELVTSFDNSTLSKKYYLSNHRMIGANSLTEDLKQNQLLFSLKTMSSWLPFYESYLPILKKINDIEENKGWEYHLFELHNISKEKEYIAIEQNAPFRILADKRKSKYRPRIVKSKEIVLKSPEEISAIRRFFSNPGYLVDVG